MRRILLTLAFAVGVLSAWSQHSLDLLKLQKIEPIKRIEFAKANQNQYLSFKPVTPQLRIFNQQKTMETVNNTSKSVSKSPLDNMPILGFGASTPRWNMPVAVPDSTMDYYIKNPMLPGAANLVFRK
ncbi:hypothetical protein [Maribellus sediminis]|uniref:hypothetical protein n=1 Tax=Maribellus sediminis TaxID=2696285 RepID=UPI0014305859|nr:hypothetical protein [Maribellus sediminis]